MTARAPRLDRIVDLRRRLHRVVNFIDENLDADLSLERLADIACLSPFHFHRLYSRCVGQSPTDTVRRLRLLRAADDICQRRLNVGQAATAAGYGSPQAFARAFRREFGRSARQMRATAPAAAAPQAAKDLIVVERPAIELDALMHDDIRSKADVLAVDAQTYAHVLGTQAGVSMAAYFDDLLTPFDRRLRCAVWFSAVRESLPDTLAFERLRIEGGFYARLRKHGRMTEFGPDWMRFIGQTLPQAGWVRRPGPVLRQFVSDRATTPPSQRLCYLYLPVERPVAH
ncbi:MAG: helix-turn-helix domain-containing protein [Reyranellaceae bacterium]